LKTYYLRPTLPPEVTAGQFWRSEIFPGLMYFGPEATDGHRAWAFFWANGDTSAEKNAVDIIEGDWVIFEDGRPQYKLPDAVFRALYVTPETTRSH
jgi:hypothetical protein